MIGNGVVGILAESVNKWERRAPLTPSHCARLLHSGRDKTGVSRIILQPSTKRIHHDAMYEDIGCEISEDLSHCGLILGIKQPKLEMILPDRAYAFFSHTHKAQKENMPLLDKNGSAKASRVAGSTKPVTMTNWFPCLWDQPVMLERDLVCLKPRISSIVIVKNDVFPCTRSQLIIQTGGILIKK